jgi:phosphate starvation-inducible membrane PsiE
MGETDTPPKRRKGGRRGDIAEIRRLHGRMNPIGSVLVESFHLLGLFAIGAATIWAAAHAILEMFQKPHASIEDLLLLFIYLEIGAMVGIYFKTDHMPVRFLIYVAITAVTRHLIGFVNKTDTPDLGLIMLSGSVLLLAFSLWVVRSASTMFPAAASDGSDIAGSEIADTDEHHT